MMRYFTKSFTAAALVLVAGAACAGAKPAAAADTRTAVTLVEEKTEPELRQEAAEDRAEFSFGVRIGNARHRYDRGMRKCGKVPAPEAQECGEHALAGYRKSSNEALEAFEASHAKAVALGGGEAAD